jgi:hypothetical protein
METVLFKIEKMHHENAGADNSFPIDGGILHRSAGHCFEKQGRQVNGYI